MHLRTWAVPRRTSSSRSPAPSSALPLRRAGPARPAAGAGRRPGLSRRSQGRVGARTALIPRRRPRSAFSLAPGRRPRAGCAAARRGLGSRAHSACSPASAASRGRRARQRAPERARLAQPALTSARGTAAGTATSRASDGSRAAHPRPPLTPRTSAPQTRRGADDSPAESRSFAGVSGLRRGAAGAAVRGERRGGRARHGPRHCGGSVTPRLGRCRRKWGRWA